MALVLGLGRLRRAPSSPRDSWSLLVGNKCSQ